MTDQKGQSIIELLVILPTSLGFMALLLWTFKVISEKQIANQLLYRASLCVYEYKKTNAQCSKSLKAKAKKIFNQPDMSAKIHLSNSRVQSKLQTKHGRIYTKSLRSVN